MIDRQFLPLLAGLIALVGTAAAEPDPGRVDAFGRRVNRADHSVQYILSDPQASTPSAKVSLLSPPSQVRAIEPARTIREWQRDGTLLFRNGRKAALLGCRPNPQSSPALERRRKVWEQKLPGKVVRLVFDEETRNASGELAAYVFLQDGTLLNETLLREGLCVLDTQASLCPQYMLRFKAAAGTNKPRSGEDQPTGPGSKTDASSAPPSPKLPKYSRGFTGLSPRTPAAVRAKRTGQDQSP